MTGILAVCRSTSTWWNDKMRGISGGIKTMAKIIGAAMALVVSATALADEWKFFQSVQITSMVQWQGRNEVLFEVAPNTYCYVGPDENINIALVMTLYSTARKADVHCFPTAVTIGGIDAYPLHRIIAR